MEGEINMKKNLEYTFKNQPLTPAICEPLITECFAGRKVTRNAIVKEVTQMHLLRGGLESEAIDVPRTIKKALENLRKKQLATKHPSYSYWIIYPKENTKTTQQHKNQNNLEKENINSNEDTIVLGAGSGSVYLFYFPEYKKDSLEKWKCKIGKTKGRAKDRIFSEATRLPEKPIIPVEIRSDNPLLLEKTIHYILTYRNQKDNNSGGGKEWFITNPKEFIEIAQSITKEIY